MKDTDASRAAQAPNHNPPKKEITPLGSRGTAPRKESVPDWMKVRNSWTGTPGSPQG